MPKCCSRYSTLSTETCDNQFSVPASLELQLVPAARGMQDSSLLSQLKKFFCCWSRFQVTARGTLVVAKPCEKKASVSSALYERVSVCGKTILRFSWPRRPRRLQTFDASTRRRPSSAIGHS